MDNETRLVPGVGRLPYPAYKGDEPYIFISYAHDDHGKVFAEIKRFNEAGFNVWYDEGIAPGNEWTEEIADALAECALFVVMMTPNSAASGNVQDEINFAIDEKKPFVAIHLEETELPRGIRLRAGMKQAILKYKMTDDEYEYKYIDAFTRLGLVRNTDGSVTYTAPEPADKKARRNEEDEEERRKRKKYLTNVIYPRASNLFKEAAEKKDPDLFVKAGEYYAMLADEIPEEEAYARNVMICRSREAFIYYSRGLAGDREAMEHAFEIYDELAQNYPDENYYKNVNFTARLLREWDTEKGEEERAELAGGSK